MFKDFKREGLPGRAFKSPSLIPPRKAGRLFIYPPHILPGLYHGQIG